MNYSLPATASSRRSRHDTALCLTTSQPSTHSARKQPARASEITCFRPTIVTADLECGDSADDECGPEPERAAGGCVCGTSLWRKFLLFRVLSDTALLPPDFRATVATP